MGKVLSQNTVVQAEMLGMLVDEAVVLAAQHADLTERLEGARKAIRCVMDRMEIDTFQHSSGNAAMLVAQDVSHWDVEKLAKILDEKSFETLCPRKAETAKLRKLVENAPVELVGNLKRALHFTSRTNLVVTGAAKAPEKEEA